MYTAAVHHAPPGTRNDSLNRAAFAFGQWVGSNSLKYEYAERLLLNASSFFHARFPARVTMARKFLPLCNAMSEQAQAEVAGQVEAVLRKCLCMNYAVPVGYLKRYLRKPCGYNSQP